MKFFTEIPGTALLQCQGSYREAKIFARKDRLYAKSGGGLVRLNQGGATSVKNMRWAEIEVDEGNYVEAKGAVTYVPSSQKVAAE